MDYPGLFWVSTEKDERHARMFSTTNSLWQGLTSNFKGIGGSKGFVRPVLPF